MPPSEYIITTEVEAVENQHGFDVWQSQQEDESEQDDERARYERERDERVEAALAEAAGLLSDPSWRRRPRKQDFVKVLLALLGRPDDLRMFVNSTYSNAEGRFVDRWVEQHIRDTFGVTVCNVTISNVWKDLREIAGKTDGD